MHIIILQLNWVEYPAQPSVWFYKCNLVVSLRNKTLNSSPRNDAYMRQWIGSALVQIIACRLFGAKPLKRIERISSSWWLQMSWWCWIFTTPSANTTLTPKLPSESLWHTHHITHKHVPLRSLNKQFSVMPATCWFLCNWQVRLLTMIAPYDWWRYHHAAFVSRYSHLNTAIKEVENPVVSFNWRVYMTTELRHKANHSTLSCPRSLFSKQ